MNLQAVALGTVSLVGAVILLLIERTTPKHELVPTRPWVYQSHFSVQLSIVVMAAMGVILITVGLIL